MTKVGTEFDLEAPGTTVRVVNVVGGLLPYLWIGDRDGKFFAATRDVEQLRALRDEITEALRRSPHYVD